MTKKEEFKEFVKDHKELIMHVNNGNMTWQKFYEMWDLYGDDADAWSTYFVKKNKTENNNSSKSEEKKIGLSDIFAYLKQIDMNQLQGNIETIQKGIGLVQGLLKKDDTGVKSTYTPRPIYQRFED